jgi:hypothetical protein
MHAILDDTIPADRISVNFSAGTGPQRPASRFKGCQLRLCSTGSPVPTLLRYRLGYWTKRCFHHQGSSAIHRFMHAILDDTIPADRISVNFSAGTGPQRPASQALFKGCQLRLCSTGSPVPTLLRYRLGYWTKRKPVKRVCLYISIFGRSAISFQGLTFHPIRTFPKIGPLS